VTQEVQVVDGDHLRCASGGHQQRVHRVDEALAVVDGADHATTFGKFEGHGLAQVVGEGGNATLTRHVVSNPSDAGWFAE
jgi:hypothetical protein